MRSAPGRGSASIPACGSRRGWGDGGHPIEFGGEGRPVEGGEVPLGLGDVSAGQELAHAVASQVALAHLDHHVQGHAPCTTITRHSIRPGHTSKEAHAFLTPLTAPAPLLEGSERSIHQAPLHKPRTPAHTKHHCGTCACGCPRGCAGSSAPSRPASHAPPHGSPGQGQGRTSGSWACPLPQGGRAFRTGSPAARWLALILLAPSGIIAPAGVAPAQGHCTWEMSRFAGTSQEPAAQGLHGDRGQKSTVSRPPGAGLPSLRVSSMLF